MRTCYEESRDKGRDEEKGRGMIKVQRHLRKEEKEKEGREKRRKKGIRGRIERTGGREKG